MNELMGDPFDNREPQGSGTPQPVGSPLPRGNRSRRAQPQPDARRLASVPPLAAAADSLPPAPLPVDASGPANNLQRALGVLKTALPFVQKLLPLLDGHVATAVSNVLTQAQQPPTQPARPPQTSLPAQVPPQVQARTIDLAPVHEGIRRIQADQREMRAQIADHTTAMKKVEDSLDMVREATDRNTLEQQELMEDLKNVGTKVNVVTLVVLAMLLVSMLLNLVLYLHMQRVLP